MVKHVFALALLAAMLLMVGCLGQPSTSVTITTDGDASSYPQYQTTATPTPMPEPEIDVDLRALFSSWNLVFPDAQTSCLTKGGTYHWEKYWVGCEGAGPDDPNFCFGAAIQLAQDQCHAVSGVWLCQHEPNGDAYCRIV